MTNRFRFDCSNCEIDIVVDAGVRVDFLENGCPICDVAADRDDFEEMDVTEDTQSA